MEEDVPMTLSERRRIRGWGGSKAAILWSLIHGIITMQKDIP